MKIGSIFPWFGGKRTLASDIVEELGAHKAYWDLFCGSLAVPLAKMPALQETVCDLHGDLINAAWVLQREESAVQLYGMVNRSMFTEDLFEKARHILSSTSVPETPDVDRAYWYFVFSWMGRNGLAGTSRALTSALAIRYTSGGGSPVTRFRSAGESIPPWHYRLLNMLILKRDAFTLLPEIEDKEGTCLYIDSPYLFETRSDGAAHEKGARYLHDFDGPALGGLFAASSSEEDKHDLLARELRRFEKARVVISYYDHPRLKSLYEGFTFRSLTMHKNIASQNRRGLEGVVDAPEILIMKGPSYAGMAAPKKKPRSKRSKAHIAQDAALGVA